MFSSIATPGLARLRIIDCVKTSLVLEYLARKNLFVKKSRKDAIITREDSFKKEKKMKERKKEYFRKVVSTAAT